MKFNAEIFDKLQFLFETYKFNDHQLHCVMKFDNKINKDIMKKAINLMFKIFPILASVYVEDKGEPYWKAVEFSTLGDIIITVNNEEDFNDFIISKTNEFTGPQMKSCIFSANKDSVGIIMNHMICDAAGFKEYIYLLSDLYSKLIIDGNYSPENIMNGDRSLKRINEKFSLKDTTNALVFRNKESNEANHYSFPLSPELRNVRPFIITHTISQNRFYIIKNYCKKYKVTINDVVLAAYYRAIYKTLGLDNKSKLNISIMVDMRRNLEDRNIDAICNLASTTVTHIDYDVKDNFNDTVLKVNKDMALKKNKFIGFNGFVKISVIFKLFRYKKIKKIMKKVFKNPLICMTNLGILDFKKLIFKGSSVNEAFMCGSIKYKPYFQVALSSFRDSITFSVNLYGDIEDKKRVEDFLHRFDDELPLL